MDALDFLGLLCPPPPGFVRYCGTCGAVWGGCACERKAVVAEAQEKATPAPVVPDDLPVVVRYGVEICPVCDFPKEYCGCHVSGKGHGTEAD